MDRQNHLTSILENHLTFSPHIVSSEVLTRDGLCLASTLSTERDEDFFGAMGAVLIGNARRTVSQFLGEHAKTVIVKSDRFFIMATPCDKELILAVVLTQQVGLNEMMQTVEHIAETIGDANFEII